MRLALGALQTDNPSRHADAVVALRAALAEPAPVQDHWSDCSTNNEPAYQAGDCDCMPTPAMCRAAVEFMNGAGVYDHVPREALDIEEGIYRSVWAAMEAAAPQAQQPAPPADVPMLTEEEIDVALHAALPSLSYASEEAFIAGVRVGEQAVRQKAGLP